MKTNSIINNLILSHPCISWSLLTTKRVHGKLLPPDFLIEILEQLLTPF